MSICRIAKIEQLRGERYMLTTDTGVILTTRQPRPGDDKLGIFPTVGVRGAIAAMTGPFWAAVTLDDEGYVAVLEGVEF